MIRLVLLSCAGIALLTMPASAQQEPVEVPAREQGRGVRYVVPTGTPTASGEPYNPERLTVAHPTLPFGTLVELTNVANGRTVTARVNDRGPIPEGAFLAVSAAAADRLALSAGGGEVVLQLGEAELAFLRERARREQEQAVAAPPAVAASFSGYTVQIASFSDEARARAKADELRGAWVHPVDVGGSRVYRVCYGVFPSAEAATTGQARLRAHGIEGFVKGLDTSPAASEAAPVQPAPVQPAPVQPTTAPGW